MLLPGKKLGRYEIIEQLGSGGFGTVYLALDTWLAQEVAIKVPHNQKEEFYELLKEARLQANLRHENIATLLTVDRQEGIFFMVMEYVKGKNLAEIIKERAPLSVEESLNYLEQILKGVAFAHRHSVIHRDLRPSNILISEQGVVKITDFGTSVLLEGPYATTRIGSPPYMAPEHFEGRATFLSDIYSVGCIAYEMLTGHVPIEELSPKDIYLRAKKGDIKPLHQLNPSAGRGVSALVMKALQPDPAQRYRSADEFLEAVRRFKQEMRSGPVRFTPPRARPERKLRKCWNCGRMIVDGVKVCPYCGQPQ